MNIKSPKIEEFMFKEEKKSIEYIQKRNPPGNEIIYKYRNWNDTYHRRILEGKLYFSSSVNFNDPFDGRVPINDLLLQDEDFSSQLDTLIEIIISKRNRKYQYESKKYHIIDKLDCIYNYAENELGLLCFSGIRDNVLMWSHYANNHKGFLVGFDFNLIHKELASSFDWVRYINEINIENKKMLEYSVVPFLKSESWYYEEEIRFVKEGKENINIEFQVSINSIKEVILGMKMNELDKQMAYYYCKEFLPKTDVLYVSASKNGYSLEFDNYKPKK